MSGFTLTLKSSGGEAGTNVPFTRPDNYIFQIINNRINNNPNQVAGAGDERIIKANDPTTCAYLDGFYSGTSTPTYTVPLGSSMACEYFKAILYDDNDNATGYVIAPCATYRSDYGFYGISVHLIKDSDGSDIMELSGATTNNLPTKWFIFERPDGNIIFGLVNFNNSWDVVRDLKYAYVNLNAFKAYNNGQYARAYGGNVETGLISEEFGTPSEEGGYTGGTFDDSSDTIAIPTMPSIGITSAGFVNVYNPSVGGLQNFGAELFPDLSFSPVTPTGGASGVVDALENMAQALVDFGNQIPQIVDMYINSNLINYVIDCHILPVAPTVGASQNIKVGFKQFTATAPVVSSDYVDFDCGSLNVGEYYANFIDYAPYTHAKLFLPFVGFVDLQPEFFQSGTVNIIYRFNIIDGSFMAFVLSTSSKSKLTNSVIMQFGGNACVHIPITGVNYSSMVSGVVGGAAALVSSQSGVSGLNQRAGSAITSAITSAVDVAQSKPPVQQSNGYNATTSFLSVRTPYLLIERSVSNFSINYTEEKGIPSNITSDFNTLSGFTQATSVHLDGITATEAEKDEIAALLAQGVIL